MALKGETQLLFASEQDAMIYCVADTSDEDLAVIIGIKTQETLKKLLNNECFNDRETSFALPGWTNDYNAGTNGSVPGTAGTADRAHQRKNMALVEQMEADCECRQIRHDAV